MHQVALPGMCAKTSRIVLSLTAAMPYCLQRVIMVPAILQALLKTGLAAQLGQAECLTYVMIGAAPLGSRLQEKGTAALGVRLVQGYGELAESHLLSAIY